jgi:hypothetical protein
MYGLVLDGDTVTSVQSWALSPGNSMNSVLNSVYASDFSSVSNANVATTVATNLGLTGTLLNQASAYIAAQLNAAPAGSQGATIMNILSMFGQMTNDPIWGAAATAWQNTVTAATNYAQNNAAGGNIGVSTLAALGQTITVSAGINQTYNGSASGNTAFNVTNVALNNGETLNGFGTGNALNVVETGSVDTTFGGPFSPKITGIQTANLFAGQSVGQANSYVAADTTGWTGLTQLNATAPGNITLKAAATTDVTANSQNQVFSGNQVSITGGNNDTVTNGSSVTVKGAAGAVTVGSATQSVIGYVTIEGGASASVYNSSGAVTIGDTTPVTGAIAVTSTNMGGNSISVDGGTNVTIVDSSGPGNGNVFLNPITPMITVGANTAPTGTINITANEGTANQPGWFQAGSINVTGGTVDIINVNAVGNPSVGAYTYQGPVTVTGGVATTTVTVNQTAPVATVVGSNAASGNGVVGVSVVNAAPGVQGVTAVTGVIANVAPAPAVKAVAGNGVGSTGNVNIADANAPSSTAATLTANSGTIATVTLANFASANISSAALNNLTLSGTTGAINLYEGGSNATTNTTLTLSANGLGNESASGVVTTASFTDNSNQFKVINVTTGTSGNYLSAFSDSALTTLSVAGSSVLDLSLAGTLDTALTSVKVTGGAGFAGSLNDTTTTFTAGTSTGLDTITISADATQKITGGTNVANELILNATGSTFTTGNTGANVSGFTTLGLDAAVGSSTVNLKTFGTGIISVVDITDTGSLTLTNVASTSSLTLDVSTAGVIYQTGDTTGTTDTVTVTLASPTTSTYAAGVVNTATALNLEDTLGQGIGHVNIVSNNVGFATNNVITTLTDNNISVLNVSGTAGLAITNFTTQSGTSFTINNTDTGNYIDSFSNANVNLGVLTDVSLTNLNFTGSNNSSFAGVVDNVGVTGLTIANTGTSTGEVAYVTAPQLTSLTLTGNVQLGAGNTTAVNATNGFADTASAGVTISGATDNSAVDVSLSGAAANKTDTINLGNGNNFITDASTTGTVNVTVGSGANLINLGGTTTDTTGAYTITLGTHASTTTAFDQVDVGTMGNTYAAAPSALPVTNFVIAGMGANDVLYLGADAATTVATAVALNTNLNNPLFGAAAANSSGGFIANLEVAATTTLHSVQYGYFGGNTYIAEASGAASSTTMTLVELTGVHTIATTTAHIGGGHIITLAS